MSRELRLAVVALVGVVALYFAVGSILPQTWSVETSSRLPGPPERIVPLLADFNAWQRWSTLAGTARSDTTVTIEGEPGKPGHQLVWRSSGNEAMLKLARVGQDGIDYDFLSRLGKEGEVQPHGHGEMRLKADGKETVLQWRDSSVVAGFTERWFAWFGAQQEAAKQFQEASLAKLRVELEGK